MDIGEILSTLFYGPFFALADAVWSWCMGVCTGLMATTPEAFSSLAWEYVRDTLYPWAIGIGISLTNLFYLIGFCRAATNFRENITLEVFVESMIRLIVLNILLLKGFDIIRMMFSAASYLASDLMQLDHFNMYTTDADIGAHLFWWLFGFAYFVVTLVCGIMIILTLYGRYIKLYLLTVLFPLATPALVLGRGADSTAYAWIRTFIANVFEIVIIALTMSIAAMLIEGASLLQIELPVLEYFDGAAQAINSLISIILMTAAVKGTSSFMRQALAL